MMLLRLSFVALLGFSVVSATQTLSRPTEEQLFVNWQQAFDQSYDSDEETALRMKIFMDNHGKKEDVKCVSCFC